MINSADPSNWSGSALFAKAVYIRVQQDWVKFVCFIHYFVLHKYVKMYVTNVQLFYHNLLDWSIFNSRASIRLVFSMTIFIKIHEVHANSVDPDQTAFSKAE